MDHQITSNATNSIPEVVVTESPPISMQTESVASIVRKIESIPEVSTNGAPSQSVEQFAEQDPQSSNISSGEFVPSQECNECVAPVPEQLLNHVPENSTSIEIPEPDYFRNADTECCTNWGLHCAEYYEKIWYMIHSRYALPVWLLLLALPISAGYMGALYMYSCPASHSLPMLKFIIGISLMAVFSFRICLIIRRMTTTAEGDDLGHMLHTLLLISTFLSVVFFITESMAFWKMAPTTHHGTSQYCDPHFVTFSFWWNCAMCVVMVPVFFYPA